MRELRETVRRMLKENGAPPAGKWADIAVLEPVRDYKARHASTMLTFDAVAAAIDQIAAKRRPRWQPLIPSGASEFRGRGVTMVRSGCRAALVDLVSPLHSGDGEPTFVVEAGMLTRSSPNCRG